MPEMKEKGSRKKEKVKAQDKSAFAIGVDLGGTNLRIAAVDERGKLLDKVTTDTGVARPREEVIAEMCRAIQSLAAKRKANGKLAGVGVGVPGIIDLRSGTLRESPNLLGWHDYPVREEIERRLGTRVILENDANAAALGEKWLGAGREVDDLCMMTLGTGVGGGIVLGGRIWHGMTGMAGELGHITVEPEGPPCGCGNRGCVEQFCSATAIERMAREAAARGQAPELARAARENPAFCSETVCQLAEAGDIAAREIFGRVGRALGILVAALVNTFNLPMYVIGGGVAEAWEMFSPAMLGEVRKRSFVYAATSSGASGGKTVITRAQLGSDAGLFGAARLALRRR
ncbi:MAG: ROK family protein [Terriglobales bacterium]